MLRLVCLNAATLFIHLKECMVSRRRHISSTEEVVADLHTYLERLNEKCGELEVKIQKCKQRALFHKQKAAQEASSYNKKREISRAKIHLLDKHRLQDDQDRTLRFMHLIRQQIDSLTSSQLDNIMVDAMKQYNMTTKRMGLPDKTREIDNLGREIQERFTEVEELQKLLSEATDPNGTSAACFNEEDDEELMLELESLGLPDDIKEEEPIPKTKKKTDECDGLRQRTNLNHTSSSTTEAELSFSNFQGEDTATTTIIMSHQEDQGQELLAAE